MENNARDDAEKQRRGIEVLKQKSEQHGANVCTTDGRPPDPDYAELYNAPKPVKANGQHESYYVLCEDERKKGFVRPVRASYRHVGIAGPKFPLIDLTAEQKEQYDRYNYIKYEKYPEQEQGSVIGRFWTQAQLDKVGKGCGYTTTMGTALAETYARDPGFYGATFCSWCGRHLPVGKDGEFVWDDGSRVGT